MKRPMAVIGITFLITLVLVCSVSEILSIVLISVSVVVLILSYLIKRLRQVSFLPSVCLAVVAACLVFLIQNNLEYKPQLELIDKTVSIEGTVVEKLGKSQTGTNRYIIKTNKINGKERNIKIKFSSKKLTDVDCFDKVKINNAKVYELGAGSEKVKGYYKSKGLYLGATSFSEVYRLHTSKKPFSYNFIKLRQYIKSTIKERLPNDEGAVIIAILIGDKSEMSRDLYENFIESGTSHIFAVSGLHLTVWSMIIYSFLRRLYVRRKKASLIASGFVLFFMTLAGFTPSVVRAGIMMIIFFGGKLLDREPDSLNSLGLAALLITFWNPFSSISVGLLLSFSSTLGILLLSPKVRIIVDKVETKIKNRVMSKIVTFVITTILISISAIIFSFPVLTVCFGAISLVGPLTSLLTLNVSGLTMVISGVAVILSAIPVISILKMPLFLISGLLSKYVIVCTKAISSLPNSYISLHNDYIIPWLIATILLIIFSMFLKVENKKKYRLVALLSVNILLCSMLVDKIINKDTTKIEVVNVGSDICVVLNRQRNSAIIGNSDEYYATENIENALFMNNTRQVDLMIVSANSCDNDNYDEIDSKYNVKSLNKSDNNPTNIEMWNDVKIGSVDDYTAIQINQFRLLIINNPNVNTNKIPSEFLNADILITKCSLPKNLDYSNFSNIIISDKAEKSENVANALIDKGLNATPISNNTIEIKTAGNSDFLTRSFEN